MASAHLAAKCGPAMVWPGMKWLRAISASCWRCQAQADFHARSAVVLLVARNVSTGSFATHASNPSFSVMFILHSVFQRFIGAHSIEIQSRESYAGKGGDYEPVG